MKIGSWEDADKALELIGQWREDIAYNKAETDRRKADIKQTEEILEEFVRQHETDLQERSKALTHGRVWLRQATRLVARSWGAVIEKLREARSFSYLRIEYEIDKPSMQLADDAELAKYGVKRKTSDVFGYEVA